MKRHAEPLCAQAVDLWRYPILEIFYIMALARITTADVEAIADAPAGERENLSARLQSILDEAGIDTDIMVWR